MRRYVREAATATAFEAGNQIEIQLGHFCNDRCVFCVSGQLSALGQARPIGTGVVFEALEQAAERGIRRVTFLGGEPTIQKSFLPSLERAVSLGFDDIVIFTNGAMGRTETFLERVLALGRFTWRFSIQGGDEETHDRVTQRRRSWQRLIAGLEFLSARRQDITANMCVNALSYRSLPKYVELVRRYGIRQLHIDLVRPENTGRRTEAELRAMIPRLTELAPYVASMLEGFEAFDPDFDVNIGNLPYCVLPQYADWIHHGGEPTQTLTTGDAGALDRILNKYPYQAMDATYGPNCDVCVFRSRCRGVPQKYAEFHGTDELVPRTEEPDAPRHRLVALLADIRRLKAQPPEGYRLVRLKAKRAGYALVTLADRDGRRRTVRLEPGRPLRLV